MLKTGDIVRIKMFGPGYYGGVYLSRGQAERVGEIHLVRMVDPRDNTCLLDTDSSNTWWSAEVLERIEGDLEEGHGVFSIIKGSIRPVYYNQVSEAWRTEDGWEKLCTNVWMGYYEKEELSYDIYGVGTKGDAIDVINIKGVKYLSPKYLPMFGII